MSMSFYDALQLDPAALKARIWASESQREKNFFRLALLSRALLLVGFAILFIGAGTSLFGAENSPMAVVLFCMLLSIRFVNFSYCIRDSLLALAASLAVLLLAPSLAARAPAALVAPIHLAAAHHLLLNYKRVEFRPFGIDCRRQSGWAGTCNNQIVNLSHPVPAQKPVFFCVVFVLFSITHLIPAVYIIFYLIYKFALSIRQWYNMVRES